jgi:hypothetical protein
MLANGKTAIDGRFELKRSDLVAIAAEFVAGGALPPRDTR